MKRLFFGLLLALLLATTASAPAKTATGTIPVSVQLVNGSTVAAFLVAGDVTTTVHRASQPASMPNGALPIVRVDFELQHSWSLVKRVTWDKLHQHLTIDF
jgi:hypothetical protein